MLQRNDNAPDSRSRQTIIKVNHILYFISSKDKYLSKQVIT